MTEKQNRVAVIGCRDIGATNVYSLLMGGFIEELILVDRAAGKLLNELAKLRRGVPLAHRVSVRKGNFKDAAQADIVVIAAAVSKKPSESESDLLCRNTAVVREIAAKLKRFDFGGIILVITNPVNILAQVALDASGLPANRIIGSGSGLSALQPQRLPAIPAERPKFKNRSVRLPVVAKPETAMSSSWCAALTGSAPLVDFCTPDCPDFPKMLEAIHRFEPENAGSKESTPFAVGTCVNRICEAVLLDEQEILPVTAMTGGQYGVSGVYLNLPCVVGRRGVERIVELPLGADEKRALLDTAVISYKTYKSLKKDYKYSIATAS
jgi:L-lactate dehydrogenase